MDKNIGKNSFLIAVIIIALLISLVIVSFAQTNIVKAEPLGLDDPSSVGITGGGVSGDPYIITAEEQLLYMKIQSSAYIKDNDFGKGNFAHYKLGGNVTMTSLSFWNADGSQKWGGGIGSVKPFRGVFDGNGHSIIYDLKNPVIAGQESYQAYPVNYGTSNFSLFGTLSNATIKNLTVEGEINFSSAGQFNAGIASRAAAASTISNCKNKANITVMKDATTRTAGIVAESKNSTIENSINEGKITAKNNASHMIGGVVAELGDFSVVRNCGNNGEVSSHQNNTPAQGDPGINAKIGGVIGESKASLIKDSYNNGYVWLSSFKHQLSIYAILSSVGGVVGSLDDDNYRVVTGCYNTGMVESFNYANTGGIAGLIGGVSIRNSYNTGTVKGHIVGGLVGATTTKASEILLCYNTGNVEGKTVDRDEGQIQNLNGQGLSGGGLVANVLASTKIMSCYSLGKVSNFKDSGILINKFTTPVVLVGLYGYSTDTINNDLPLIKYYFNENETNNGLNLVDGSNLTMNLTPIAEINSLYLFTDGSGSEHSYILTKQITVTNKNGTNTYVYNIDNATGDLYSSLDIARSNMLKIRVDDEKTTLDELELQYDLWWKGKTDSEKMSIKLSKSFTYTIKQREAEFSFLSFKDYKLKDGDVNFEPTDTYLYSTSLEGEFLPEIIAPGSIGEHVIYFKATKIIDGGTVEIKREVKYVITRATVNRPKETSLIFNGKAQLGVDESSALELWKKQWEAYPEEMVLLYPAGVENPIPSAIAYHFAEGDKSGINATTYQTVYALNDSFVWDSKTLYDVSVTWRIGRLEINKPTYSNKQLEKGNDVYGIDDYGVVLEVNLNDLSEEERNNYYTIAGDIKGQNVGKYYVYVTPTSNYKWSGDSNLYSFAWEITPLAINKVTKKDAALTFNGKEQIIFDNFDNAMVNEAYILSGDYKAIDANNYSVTVRLTPNYMWDNGSREDIVIYWAIERYAVNKPTAINGLVYNLDNQVGIDSSSKAGNIGDYNYSNAYSIVTAGSDSRINAGAYSAVFMLNKNFCWKDNTIDNEIVNYDINPFVVAKPTAKNHTYDGNDIIGSIVPDMYTVVNDSAVKYVINGREVVIYNLSAGSYKATNAGFYTTVWALENRTNFAWSEIEFDNAPIALEWNINKKEIIKPTENGVKVTFDGTLKSISLDNDDFYNVGYTAVGTYSAVDAGNYYFALRLNSNYMWIGGNTDESAYEWTIERYAVSKPVAINGLTYNNTSQIGVDVSSASGNIGLYVYNNAYKLSTPLGDTKKNAGTYNAVYILDKNFCWNDDSNSTDEAVVSYTIKPFVVSKPTVVNSVYNELLQTGISSIYTLEETDGVTVAKYNLGGADIVLFKLSAGVYKQYNAGTYTAVWSLESRTNFAWSETEFDNAPIALDWTINKKVLQADYLPHLNVNIGEYNESLQYGIIIEDSGKYYTYRGKISAVNAGDYQAIFNLNSNYCWAENDVEERTIDWSIEQQKVFRPNLTSKSLTYEKNTEQVGIENIPNSGVTVSGTTKAVNASSYYATFMLLNSNYRWLTANSEGLYDDVITISWEIHKKQVSIPTSNNSEYNGYDISGVNFDENLVGEAYSYTGTVKAKGIGTYVGYFTLTNNYIWSNNSTEIVEISWTIIGIEVDRPTAKTNLTYDGSVIIGVNLMDNWQEFYTVVNGSTSSKNAGVYSVLFTLKDGIVWKGSKEEQRNSYYLTYSIAKRDISQDLSISVDKDKNNLISGTVSEDYGAPIITYSIDSGVTWTAEKPKNMSYTVRAFYAGTDNYDEIVLTGYFEYVKPPNYYLIATVAVLVLALIILIIVLIIKQYRNSKRIKKLQRALSVSDADNEGLLIDQV